MTCPHDGQPTIVLDTRATKHYTKRRRECVVCHKRFTTGEFISPEQRTKDTL